jgi:hypothetical protein
VHIVWYDADMKLLSRSEFRQQTLARNGGVCVAPRCMSLAVDAHHILNRRLFTGDAEGGYFLENGAGLCSSHHLDAERTLIGTRTLYIASDISDPAVPYGFDKDAEYDTWGNLVVNGYQRIAGPLFNDEGCQRALSAAGVLWQFYAA